jgi:hypothetical protein
LPPLDDVQPHRSPSEAPSEPHRSQDQDQEQEHDQDQEQEHDQDQDQEQDKKNEDFPLPPSAVNGADTRATPEWVIARWNAIPGVEPLQLKHYTPHAGVGKKLTTRLSERKSKAWWEGFFDRVQQSTWLLDEYHPCLDWALGPQNMQKILQGNYVKTVKAKPKTAFGKLMHELGEASTESQAYTTEGGPS